MTTTDYRAKRDWLRSHPQGPRAQMVKRELRAYEREAASLDAWIESDQARLGLSPWYVAFSRSRPGQPTVSKVRHGDRDCQHIRDIGDEEVREASEAEVTRLEACGTCG